MNVTKVAKTKRRVRDYFANAAISSVKSIRTSDVFEGELAANSFSKADKAWLAVIPAVVFGLNFYRNGFDLDYAVFANLNVGNIFYASVPYLAFSISVMVIWLLAYNNHLKRISAAVISPKIRRNALFCVGTSLVGLSFFASSDIRSFAIAANICIFAAAIGFLSAIILSFRVTGVIDGAKQLENGFSYQPGQDLPHVKVSSTFPLGDEYHSISPELKSRIYLLRVKELASISAINAGWFFANVIAFVLLLVFLVFVSLMEGRDLLILESIGTGLTGATSLQVELNNPGLLVIEGLFLTAFVVLGTLSGNLRAKINSDLYGDEIYYMNLIYDPHKNADQSVAISVIKNNDNESHDGSTVKRTGLVSLFGVFEATRFTPSVAAGLLLWIASEAIAYSIIYSLFLFFSFLLNDYLDFKSGKDIICHPKRPLPSGRIDEKTARLVLVCLGITLFSTSIAFLDLMGVTTILLVTVISYIYSSFLKRLHPIIGTIVWCGAVTIAFLAPFGTEITVYLVFFLAFYSRELILDFRDDISDRHFSKSLTFGGLAGPKFSNLVPSFLLGTASMVSILGTENYYAGAYLVLFAVLLGMLAVYANNSISIRLSRAVYLAIFWVGV